MPPVTTICYTTPHWKSEPIPLLGGAYIRIARLCGFISRIYFCDSAGAQVPIQHCRDNWVTQPVLTQLHDMRTETVVPLFHDQWIIAWNSDYVLYCGSTVVMTINNTRQQEVIVKQWLTKEEAQLGEESSLEG